MEVTNCRDCGRLFNYISGPRRCPECQKKLEEKFQQVKEFLRQNPDSTISQTATENDVTVKQIKQWIREERLEFTEDSPIKLPCENCGTMIRAGKYCEKCKATMAKNLSNAIDKPKVIAQQRPDRRDAQSRMRFLDKHE